MAMLVNPVVAGAVLRAAMMVMVVAEPSGRFSLEVPPEAEAATVPSEVVAPRPAPMAARVADRVIATQSAVRAAARVTRLVINMGAGIPSGKMALVAC